MLLGAPKKPFASTEVHDVFVSFSDSCRNARPALAPTRNLALAPISLLPSLPYPIRAPLALRRLDSPRAKLATLAILCAARARRRDRNLHWRVLQNKDLAGSATPRFGILLAGVIQHFPVHE